MKFWALSYSLPANPSRYRVAVWKALKELGAVYLQPAVAVAPQREGMRQALLDIQRQVRTNGGQAALLTMEYEAAADEAALVEAFRAARVEEYAAIADDARRLEAQLDWEESRHAHGIPPEEMHRYALEAGRLARRLATARAHDFFEAAGGSEAQAALDAVAGRLPEQTDNPAKRKPRSAGKAEKENAGKKRAAGRKPARTKPAVVPPPVPVQTQAAEEPEEENDAMPVFLF